MGFKWADNNDMPLSEQVARLKKAEHLLREALDELEIVAAPTNAYAAHVRADIRRAITNDFSREVPCISAWIDSLEISIDQREDAKNQMDRAEKILADAHEAWVSSMAATAEVGAFDAIRNVQVGDMVCEITTAIRNEPAINRVGKLLKIERIEDHDLSYSIQLLNGKIQVWRGAYFIKAVVNEE